LELSLLYMVIISLYHYITIYLYHYISISLYIYIFIFIRVTIMKYTINFLSNSVLPKLILNLNLKTNKNNCLENKQTLEKYIFHLCCWLTNRNNVSAIIKFQLNSHNYNYLQKDYLAKLFMGTFIYIFSIEQKGSDVQNNGK